MGSILAPLTGFGPASVIVDFDATEDGRTVRFGRAQASIEGDGISATLASAGAFSIAEPTGAVSADAGGADWMRLSVRRLDLSRLPPGEGGGIFAAGSARGAFRVAGADGHLRVRATGPLVLSGAVFTGAAGRLPPIELSGTPTLEIDPDGWKASCPQAVARRAGATVATVDRVAVRASDAERITQVQASRVRVSLGLSVILT